MMMEDFSRWPRQPARVGPAEALLSELWGSDIPEADHKYRMKRFREFVDPESGAPIDSAAVIRDVTRMELFGLDVAIVQLPSDTLSEDRVSRMNRFWDLLGDRQALVIALMRKQD
jgi:hypothetical protein